MEFGKDLHPKWTEKEEMTLIFLAATNFPNWTAQDVRGEINALFGNERSLSAVCDRLKKDGRAIDALVDLLASNPVMVAKFWKHKGIVDDLPMEQDPMFVATPGGFKEAISGGIPAGKISSVFGYGNGFPPSSSKAVPSFFERIQKLFPEFGGTTSEDAFFDNIQQWLTTTRTLIDTQKGQLEKRMPLLVSRITRDEVKFDQDAEVTVDQISQIVKTLRD